MKRTRIRDLDSALTFQFSLPIILETAFSVALALLISQTNSTISSSALVAVSMANLVGNSVNACFSMFYSGSAIMVSRAIGAEKYREAKAITEQTTGFTLIFSSAASAILLILSMPVLRLVLPDAEPQLFSEARRYYFFLIGSTPLNALATTHASISRSKGNTKYPMISAMTSNILQLILSLVLIRVCRLNELGSGLAVLAVRLFSAVFLTTALYRDRKYFSADIRKIFCFRDRILHRLFILGSPMSLSGFLVQLGYTLTGTFSVSLGTVRATAYSVNNTLNTFCNVPQTIAYCIVSNASGHLLGAGRKADAKRAAKAVGAICISSSLALTLILILFRQPLTGLLTKNADSQSLAMGALFMLPVHDIISCYVNITEPMLRNAGDSRFEMIVTLASVWLIRVPLTWLFCRYTSLGILGLYLGNIVSMGTRAVVGTIRLRGSHWVHKNV